MKHRYTIENIENMRNEEMKMMNKREKTRKGITIFVTGLCLVAAAASVTAFGFTLNNVLKNNAQTQRPAVTAKLSENQQATQNTATIAATQPATTAPATTAAATQTATAKAVPGVHHSGAKWDGKGTPLHVFTTGKTSYGYDWTYKTDNNNVKVKCKYDFKTNKYTFKIVGTAKGTNHFTLKYKTSDKKTVSVPMTFVVDAQKNIIRVK